MVLENQLLIKLKQILHSNLFLFFFVLSVLYLSYVRIQLGKPSVYSSTTKEVTGVVTGTKQMKDYTVLEINAREKVQAFISESYSIPIGTKVKISGTFSLPDENTTIGLFNYRNYLLSKGIVWSIEVKQIDIISKRVSWFLSIKHSLYQKVSTRQNAKYYQMLIFGDSSNIGDSFQEQVRKIGISHLFALSGSHLTLLSFFLFRGIKKIIKSEKKVFLLVSIILFFYVALTSCSVSLLRAFVFFVVFKANRYFNWKFKNTTLFFYIFSLFLLYRPWWIYDIGFQYSFLICFYLITFSSFLSSKNYLLSLFKISLLSFIVSAPISMFHFYELHVLSVVWNLIFVPFVSFLVFPICFLSFLCPVFDSLFSLLICLLETGVEGASSVPFGDLLWCRLPILWYVLLEVSIYLSFQGIIRKNYFYLKIFILLCSVHFFIPYFRTSMILTFFDVGQGDCSIVVLPHQEAVIMIDTGVSIDGKRMRREVIPYLKSLGCSKIDYLILSHGDSDHLGDSINLVNHFKVRHVLFNNDDYNDLELELIKVLDNKNIEHSKEIESINIGKYQLSFLQHQMYGNENDNSNVVYFDYEGIKMLFMGDAGVEVEKDIMENYYLNNIDILKVGHHGSKTSSNKEFIDSINPKYAIISVGKNNRYGHPNKDVLDNLENSQIYRTDQEGSIIFQFKNNKLKGILQKLFICIYYLWKI